MRPQVGQVINNKYRLVRVIGDGGMGSVYEARHEVLGTTVALKFLHPELSRRSGLVQRFLQEARVSAQIQSPHVVRVSDVDQMPNGQPFIVMEYLEGKTLQTLYEELYNAGQRLSYGDALEYACQMLDGVEAAHRAGVVHRDLKPDNVMLTKGPKGEPLLKLLDFGIAKLKVTGELDRGLTRPGVIMGTPEYMAPEQAYSADAVDVRADIFSLGVIIFEMLAGRRPVGGDEPHQIASSYLSGQIAQLTDLAPHVPPDLAQVVHRAMGPKPPDRYNTLAEFRAALHPFAAAAQAPSAGAAPATPPPAAVAAYEPNNSTTVPPTGQNSPIPKTLPPGDEAVPPGAVAAGVTPAQSSPPAQVATPLGGFEARPPGGSGTSLGAPLQMVEQDATKPSPPLAAAFDATPRPGGTAVGVSLDAGNAGGYPTPQGAYGQTPAHVQQGWQPQGAYGQTPGYAQPPGYASPGQTTGKQRGGGAGIAVMLLIALGVTGVVMGGVYMSQRLSRTDEGTDIVATAPPPPTTVAADTPTAAQTQVTGALTPSPPPPPPPPVYTPPPSQPQTNTPKPTGTTTAQPSATTTASTPQTIPNPFGTGPLTFPSSLPPGIPLPPFLGGGQPTTTTTTTPRTPPTAPTSTTPAPTSTPTTSTRPRIRIPIPGRP
ncbi:MAG: protein kinase [Polyangiaceae bacterium]|nr:protein kinase [Polyangiaceae bacterium]